MNYGNNINLKKDLNQKSETRLPQTRSEEQPLKLAWLFLTRLPKYPCSTKVVEKKEFYFYCSLSKPRRGIISAHILPYIVIKYYILNYLNSEYKKHKHFNAFRYP